MELAPILAGKGLDQTVAARVALVAQPLHLAAGKPVFSPGQSVRKLSCGGSRIGAGFDDDGEWP